MTSKKAKLFTRIISAVIFRMPNTLIQRFINLFSGILYLKNNSRANEAFDYYSLSTFFMLDCLKTRSDLRKLTMLSASCRIDYLISLFPLFSKCLHNTMIGVEGIEDVQRTESGANLKELIGDFFTLTPSDMHYFLPNGIDVVLSHVTIQCMFDSRYNNSDLIDEWGGFERPYHFAKKLNTLTSNPNLTVILSSAVSTEEHFVDNSCWLNHQKLIDSFTKEGFILKNQLFDKGYGVNSVNKPNNFSRISETLPLEHLKTFPCVIGNYHFERSF